MLGIQIPHNPRLERAYTEEWTAEETQTLIAIYPTATNKELRKAIPNKTLRQCSSRASALRAWGADIPARKQEHHAADSRLRASRLQTCDKRPGKNGYPGISFINELQKWRAQITFNRKTYAIGTFETKEDAAAARQLVNEAVQPIIESMNNRIRRLRENGDTESLKQLQHKTAIAFEQAVRDTRRLLRK